MDDSPFLLLVGIILSQNTSDKNALEAARSLIERDLAIPEKMAEAPLDSIKYAIRKAGLYNQKAFVLKNLAAKIAEGKLDLKALCRMSLEEARKTLLSIKGIGRKTADVYLSAYCGKKVFPVDRHILRITSRVNGRKLGYEEASRFWMSLLKPDEYRDFHLLLIQLGRSICKPVNPRCDVCPLRDICSTGKKR